MSRFEDMLRLYMNVRGISQRGLARELDMPVATLHRILHGKDCQVSNVWSLLQWLMDPIDDAERVTKGLVDD